MHAEIGVATRRIDVDLDAGRDCYLKVAQVGRSVERGDHVQACPRTGLGGT